MATEHEAARNDDDHHPPREDRAPRDDPPRDDGGGGGGEIEFRMSAALHKRIAATRTTGYHMHVRMWATLKAGRLQKRHIYVTPDRSHVTERNDLCLHSDVFTAKGAELHFDDEESYRLAKKRLETLARTMDADITPFRAATMTAFFLVMCLVLVATLVFRIVGPTIVVSAVMCVVALFVVLVEQMYGPPVRIVATGRAKEYVTVADLKDMQWRWKHHEHRETCEYTANDVCVTHHFVKRVAVPSDAHRYVGGRVVFDLGSRDDSTISTISTRRVARYLDEIRDQCRHLRTRRASILGTDVPEAEWVAW